MKILILGGTGPTGQLLVKQALERSHQVTVLARDPAKLNLSHQNLDVITGDVLDQATLTNSLKGKDAVLSALGKGKSLKSSHLITKSVTNLISGMKATNVNRVIMLSAFGVGETFQQANFIQKLIFRTFLKSIYSDKTKADSLLGQSPLDWTLVYPVVLTNGPLTSTYKVGEKLPMKGMPKISRADVAAFMLNQLNDNSYLRKIAVLMS
ncbi:MAG: SDR family oxidoreductase [Chitinophagaceae bacterium]